MEKVLVLVFDTHTSEDRLELCTEVLQCFKPLVHILSPVDRNKTARMASNEGVKEAQVYDRLLHEIYVNLYHLEELFTKQGLQVTIAAKEMGLPDGLLVEIRKVNPEMLILIGRADPQLLDSLYGSIHVPMLLLPQED